MRACVCTRVNLNENKQVCMHALIVNVNVYVYGRSIPDISFEFYLGMISDPVKFIVFPEH